MAKLVPFKTAVGTTIQVADIMVRSLDKYLAVFPTMDYIREVWLFGSTLEERCTEESDIDLYVVISGDGKLYHRFLREIYEKCDVAVFDDIIGCSAERFYSNKNWGLKNEVKRTGRLIYEGK